MCWRVVTFAEGTSHSEVPHGLLATVLTVVVQAARGARNALLGAGVLDSVAAVVPGGHVQEVLVVALTPGIHSLVAAVIDVVRDVVVVGDVVVDHHGPLAAECTDLWVVGPVEGVWSLEVTWAVPAVTELGVGHTHQVR